MTDDAHHIMEAFTHFGHKKTHGKSAQQPVAAEDEQRRLDASCWKGYHKQGTKMKGNTRVNNCVKSEEEMMPAPTFYDLLHRMKSGKKHVPVHDKHMHDLAKQDSREPYDAQDYVQDMEMRGEQEEAKNAHAASDLPSLFQFAKMLKHHDWTYEYSDDSSVWRKGAAQAQAINKALSQGGKPYQDVYDRFHQQKDGVAFEHPAKDAQELQRDSDALHDMHVQAEQVAHQINQDMDAASIAHPQQLWNLYWSAFSILKGVSRLAAEKNYAKIVKACREHNI